MRERRGARLAGWLSGVDAERKRVVVFPVAADRHAVVRKFLHIAAGCYTPDARAAAVHLIDTAGGEAFAIGRIMRRAVDGMLFTVRHFDHDDVVVLILDLLDNEDAVRRQKRR